MEQKRGWKRRVQHLLDITMISFFFLSFFFFRLYLLHRLHERMYLHERRV